MYLYSLYVVMTYREIPWDTHTHAKRRHSNPLNIVWNYLCWKSDVPKGQRYVLVVLWWSRVSKCWQSGISHQCVCVRIFTKQGKLSKAEIKNSMTILCLLKNSNYQRALQRRSDVWQTWYYKCIKLLQVLIVNLQKQALF